MSVASEIMALKLRCKVLESRALALEHRMSTVEEQVKALVSVYSTKSSTLVPGEDK